MDISELHKRVNNAFDTSDFNAYGKLLMENPSLYGDHRKSVIDNKIKYAVDLNSPDMLDVLVALGGDVNAEEPDSAIVYTCLGGSCKVESARRLLELGAKINHEVDGEIRCQTLDLAISKGNMEMVQLLIQYGAAYNAISLGMTALDHALSREQKEIADYLRSIGGKTAIELGWVPPPPPEHPEIMTGFYAYRFGTEPIATIEGMLDAEPRLKIRVFDIGYEYVLQTEGMASKPIPIDTGNEDHAFVEIELELPYEWPIGKEMLKSDENSWPATWLRRLAMHPHLSGEPIGKLFFYPNGSPPQPFASNTELSVWMLLVSDQDPVYISDEKQIVIYKAVPLFKEEYDLVQKRGIGELAKRFDANKLHSHKMFLRKNVGLE